MEIESTWYVVSSSTVQDGTITGRINLITCTERFHCIAQYHTSLLAFRCTTKLSKTRKYRITMVRRSPYLQWNPSRILKKCNRERHLVNRAVVNRSSLFSISASHAFLVWFAFSQFFHFVCKNVRDYIVDLNVCVQMQLGSCLHWYTVQKYIRSFPVAVHQFLSSLLISVCSVIHRTLFMGSCLRT